MDPVTTSTAFATIVGLIGLFKQEAGSQKGKDTKSFMEWLEHHRHEEIKDLILRTHGLSEEIDQLLSEEHQAILAKLNSLDNSIAALASHIAGLGGMVQAIHPGSELSEQAFYFLSTLVRSGAKRILYLPHLNGVSFQLDNGQELDVKEGRFLEDDLDGLVQLGLLTVSHGSHSSRTYRITRNAAAYVNMCEQEA